MANTFDTSRVGGGTYEFELDSTGNYKLKSVGFEAVNKLNLPDLKTSDVTTPPVATIPKQPDVADPFKKLGTQNTGGREGGNQDYSGVMLKTPEVKDVSVRDAGQPMTNIAYEQKQDIKALQTKADLAAPQESIGATDSIQPEYQDAILRGQTGVKYSKPPSLASKATSAVQNTVSNVVDSVKDKKPFRIAGPLTGIANLIAAMAPEKTVTQKVNEDYFNVKENGRIAGNPATDVFAGMNAVSAFGNISEGAQKRLDTREATIDKTGDKPGDKPFDDTDKLKADKQNYDNAKEYS
jgi:hypothetical protein